MSLKSLPRHLLVATLALLLIACGSSDDPDPQDPNANNGDPPAANQNNDEPGNNDDPAEVSEAPGQLLQGSKTRDDDPDVDDQLFDEFTADNRSFAFSILETLQDDEGDDANLFLSPHSISLALAMTYAGAQEDTKAEMAEALHFLLDDDELHPAFNKLDQELATRADFEPEEDEDVAFDLDIVNQTWGHETFPFYDDYLDLLSLHYGAGMYAVDFVSNFEQIRQEINAWVEAQTEDRIEDLLPEDSLDSDTRFVLVNAIYFFGSWKHPFEEDLTEDRAFTRLDDSTVDVPMMRLPDTITTDYFEDEDTVAVSLPYIGDDVSMLAIMPADENDDFLQWEAEFGRQEFDAVTAQMSPMEGYVEFPSFEDEGDFDLQPAFKALGMEDAFDPSDADFTAMYDRSQSANLYITDIFHKSFVSVDEEGTEAAAATAVVMGIESAPMEMFDVTFDRPFYYAIYDHPTDTILFLGRMVDPS